MSTHLINSKWYDNIHLLLYYLLYIWLHTLNMISY